MVHSAATAGMLALGSQNLTAAVAGDAKPLDMAIARWTGQKDLKPAQIDQVAGKLAEKAVEAMGGLQRFVTKGSVVWIKPNIGWDRTPEQAANTNPEIVATIVRLCFEAGAKTVKVGDNTCNPAIKTYANSGIAAAARRAGAEVLFLDRSRFKETAIQGERVKSIPIFPGIMECDLVINIPIAKHHCLSDSTLCMKNYMGVIENRKSFHQDIPTCLADITRFMKPRICILDAVRILTAHGPTGGKLEDVALKYTVAAGVDIVALDAFGAEIMGKRPQDLRTVAKAQEVGLGKMDYRSLALREIAVS
jgi:uncharacterized protein (DUF362 family)